MKQQATDSLGTDVAVTHILVVGDPAHTQRLADGPCDAIWPAYPADWCWRPCRSARRQRSTADLANAYRVRSGMECARRPYAAARMVSSSSRVCGSSRVSPIHAAE
jgi:hypothetical protein